MPRYRIPVTRDVTETGYAIVDAPDLETAVSEALMADITYEPDDCAGSSPYFADDFQSDESEFLL